MSEAPGDRGWVIAFRAFLALLALGTLKAVATIAWDRAAFFATVPAARTMGVALPIAVAVVGLLGALGAMTLRRAGTTLLMTACALALGLEAWLQAPSTHLAIASAASAIVLVFVWRLRDRIH